MNEKREQLLDEVARTVKCLCYIRRYLDDPPTMERDPFDRISNIIKDLGIEDTPEPTPALPPELEQCVRTIDGVQCRNRRKGAGIAFCDGPCDFTPDPESKPDSPTCPARVPMTEVQKVEMYHDIRKGLLRWNPTMYKIFEEIVKRVEDKHGIKP